MSVAEKTHSALSHTDLQTFPADKEPAGCQAPQALSNTQIPQNREAADDKDGDSASGLINYVVRTGPDIKGYERS